MARRPIDHDRLDGPTTRHQIKLDRASLLFLRYLGGGELCAGVREAARLARLQRPEYQPTDVPTLAPHPERTARDCRSPDTRTLIPRQPPLPGPSLLKSQPGMQSPLANDLPEPTGFEGWDD